MDPADRGMVSGFRAERERVRESKTSLCSCTSALSRVLEEISFQVLSGVRDTLCQGQSERNVFEQLAWKVCE